MYLKEKISTYIQNMRNATKKGVFLLTIPFALASCNDERVTNPNYIGTTNNGTEISAYINSFGLVRNIIAKKNNNSVDVRFYRAPRVSGSDSINHYVAGIISPNNELLSTADSMFNASRVTFMNEDDTVLFSGVKNIPSSVNSTIAELISDIDSLKTAEYNAKLSEMKSAFK